MANLNSKSDQVIDENCCYDLTIASVFQNEAPYLKEWIEFHKLVGVQHFLLVDDRSIDNCADVLLPYIAAGEVELLSAPCPKKWQGSRFDTYQCALLKMFCELLRGVSRWVALIDLDEFIVPVETTNVPDFLRKHEDRGGIYVRWEPFGTSYIKKLSPNELVTDSFYLKWKFIKGHEMLGKSIVKPHRVANPNTHTCTFLPGYSYFDSNPDMQNEFPPIKLHHYWSRDEDFLINEKLRRKVRINGWKIDDERVEFFKHLFNDVPDHGMKRFMPELKRRMAI